MQIGILALQGAFQEHADSLHALGAETFEIRQKADLSKHMDGLVLPGGESTVMGKLLRELDCFDWLHDAIEEGLPTLGTCAGLLLLAKEIDGGAPGFATMDIAVKRNAYGRQLGSFSTTAQMDEVGEIPMTFIRAPYVEKVFGQARALATVDGHIVAARQGNQLVTAFHPELTKDTKTHEYFLGMIK
jgi:5'-phosphate synthase pdxT subunit